MAARQLSAWFGATVLIASSLVACGKKTPTPPAPGPAEVGVVTLEPRTVTLTTELPGRTSAFRSAEVRARVTGIVLRRHFVEGSDVKEGDLLFEIDPSLYVAALESAKATAARASATAANAKIQADRTARMFQEGVGTKIDADNAAAALRVAQADMAAAAAAIKAAQVNLDFTKVTAPITGRIGRAVVTEGAYVQSSPATLLATIQQLNPMFVDLTWSSAEAQQLRRDLESGKLKNNASAEVKLTLDNGVDYAQTGKLQFTDVTVDPNTGSISLRALFPNEDAHLLPGMFVRARIEEGSKADAILVPQRGVTRDSKGRATALVVNDESKVERRQLVTDRAMGNEWLVLEGLKAGERVIVDGLQKARPDAVVVPVVAEEKKKESAR